MSDQKYDFSALAGFMTGLLEYNGNVQIKCIVSEYTRETLHYSQFCSH